MLPAASILVYRSTWLLLDELKWACTTAGLPGLLAPGVVRCFLALRAINDD